jgi:hypothetical protein
MPVSLPTPNSCLSTTRNNIEISVRGRWVTVPALSVEGKDIIVRGKWVKKGIVVAEEWLETELEDPELCVRKLKEQKSHALRADIFTFAQKLPGMSPRYEYPMEWDSVAAIHITSFKDWWEKLPQETRKNVRRAQKRGVVVTVRHLDDDLIKGIIGVNNDSPVRQGVHYVHYGKTFDQVKKDQSSYLDRSVFVCAYLGEELIGFMKMVCRGEVASILQMLPKTTHQDKRPANALLAKAVELCEARGISYLTYGLFNYGNKRDSSLRDFKIRNGFEEMLTPRFYVPLTIWGSLCMKLKIHRGLLGILPPSAIKLAIKARAKWYSRKQSTSRCSSMPERSTCNRQMGCSNPPAGSNT